VPMAVNGNGSVTLESSRVMHSARRHTVGKDYFETIGIPILLGRGFRREDEKPGASAVIISQKLANELWAGEDPVGRRMRIGNDELRPFKLFDFSSSFDHRPGVSGTFEVVGVAKNVVDSLLMVKAEGPPVIYFPLRRADYTRPSLQGVTLMVRATPGVDVVGAVRREISMMAANVTPFSTRSMRDQIDRMVLPVRVAVLTYGVLGVFGLILASVGLAGVTAYSVARRGREIGIRMALGAQSRDVLGLVMKEGVVLVALGTIVGLACAWAGMRVLSGILSAVNRVTGTSASEPMLLLGAPLLLAALALGACFVPARRAIRVDPVVMLRQE
jgi:ABC-type antimicrobial peptide transport system permease subunit